jgi:hypothetical protein
MLLQAQPVHGADLSRTEEALKAVLNIAERVQLLLVGRLMRIARDGEKSAALAKCAA